MGAIRGAARLEGGGGCDFRQPRPAPCRGRCPIRLPSEQAAPKWKTFIATWAAVLPLLLVLNALVGLLPLPKLVRLPLSSVLLTASLTWFVLPFVRRRVRPWLLADDEGIRKEPD
jgi:antibiotic biosynthesis monooxygenase (ABM) superfamily enzyme